MNDAQQARLRTMMLMRAFEEATLDGMRKGEIHGELHTAIGQEAIGAGMMELLLPGDAVVSTHRNHCHAIAKGVPLHGLLAEIFERSTGICGGFGGHMHPFHAPTRFSATGIVGASLPVALGYAYASRLSGDASVAVGVTGDGGSHTGGFHETLVMAAALKLPLVVLVENNSLAISVSFADVSPTLTVAERASAYGIAGRRIDGTDVDIVAEAFGAAMAHARGGNGPYLLEAVCHRFRGHFEGDSETYRDKAERRRVQQSFDPVTLYRTKLEVVGTPAAELDRLQAETKSEIAAVLAAVRLDPMPDPADALRHVFVEAA